MHIALCDVHNAYVYCAISSCVNYSQIAQLLSLYSESKLTHNIGSHLSATNK